MSDCIGIDCDHPDHGPKPSGVTVLEPINVVEEASQELNPIITPQDNERWPLMEVTSQPCSLPINDTDAAMIGKMDALLDVLGDQAAGIAAVQIGYPKRIFLLREKTFDPLTNQQGSINRAFINPVVLEKSKETKRDGEACLSLPGFGAVFKRPKRIKLQYHDLDGSVHTEEFRGFWARAICHEMDHLNGIIIAQHFEREMAKQVSQTKFGMKLTPHRRKVVAERRAQKKRAKASKRANRG